MTPIMYDYYYVNGGPLGDPDPATDSNPNNLKIFSIKIAWNSSGTGGILTITPPATTPGSYGGAIASKSGFDPFSDLEYSVININTNTYTISGLTPGKKYYLRVRAWTGSNQTGTNGDYYYDEIVPPKPSSVGGVDGTVTPTKTPDLVNALPDVGTAIGVKDNRVVQTSLFTVTNNSKEKNQYSVVVKDSKIDTSYKYYSFGSSIFFTSNVDQVSGSGGIGIFTDDKGTDGYYVLIQTTANLANTSDKEVKIFKIVNGKRKVLNDSQEKGKTLTGVLGGISYKLDVTVEVKEDIRIINAYVNNFRITAVDSDVSGSDLPVDKMLPVTSNIAMFANTGKVSFDYIYATPLTEQQYDTGIMENIYQGKYGIKTLSFLYGNKIIEDKKISPDLLPFLEEFGTVARELRRIKVKYEARPADPVYASVGINKFVSVLGQRLNSFGAEIYVINNSGTYVPLDDSKLYSFTIIGNYVVTTGQHEYVSNELSETTVAEPVIFESSWIQSEQDAKNLSSWIEGQWSKQQQILNIEIFSNPLISVGDIITVNYPKNNLSASQKFVVTSVDHSFGEGLSTSISARSIYS